MRSLCLSRQRCFGFVSDCATRVREKVEQGFHEHVSPIVRWPCARLSSGQRPNVRESEGRLISVPERRQELPINQCNWAATQRRCGSTAAASVQQSGRRLVTLLHCVPLVCSNERRQPASLAEGKLSPLSEPRVNCGLGVASGVCKY